MAYRKKNSETSTGKRLMGIALGLIMITSIGGFILGNQSSPDNTYNHRGTRFIRNDNFWHANINKIETSFYYLPPFVDNVVIDGSINQIKAAKMIYLTYETTSDKNNLPVIDLLRFTMNQEFPKYFGTFVYQGSISPAENSSIPVVTCQNATPLTPVIVLKPIQIPDSAQRSAETSSSNNSKNNTADNTPRIIQQGSCFILEASNQPGFLQLRDKLFYELLDIDTSPEKP